jgi:hypothetical protein
MPVETGRPKQIGHIAGNTCAAPRPGAPRALLRVRRAPPPARAAAARSCHQRGSIILGKNRRHIGTSQSKRPARTWPRGWPPPPPATPLMRAASHSRQHSRRRAGVSTHPYVVTRRPAHWRARHGRGGCIGSKWLVIESRWVSKPLAFAGQLTPRRPNARAELRLHWCALLCASAAFSWARSSALSCAACPPNKPSRGACVSVGPAVSFRQLSETTTVLN